MAWRAFAGALARPTKSAVGAGGFRNMSDMKGAAPLLGLLLVAVILLASQATAGAAQLIA